MSMVVHSNWWLASTWRHVQRTKSNTHFYAKSTWFLAYLLVMHNFRLNVLSNFSSMKYIFDLYSPCYIFVDHLGQQKMIHHVLPFIIHFCPSQNVSHCTLHPCLSSSKLLFIIPNLHTIYKEYPQEYSSFLASMVYPYSMTFAEGGT